MPRKPKLKRIRIQWRKSETAWGYAFAEERLIQLDPRMTDETLLEVASHEVIHVVAPYLEEETVELLGRHIGDVLTRLGFRRGD